MRVPEELRALLGAPVPDDVGGPTMTVLGGRNAFVWFEGDDVRIWGPPDGSEVWMLTVRDPDFTGGPDDVLASLGEPALRLDAAVGTVPIAGGEWVYPDRGLAVFADEEDERVWQVNLFAPTDTASYQELYREPTGARRWPER